MEFKNKCKNDAIREEDETKQTLNSMKFTLTSNNMVQNSSNKDNMTILIPNTDACATFVKIGCLDESSQTEKDHSSNLNLDELSTDKKTNILPTNILAGSIDSDAKLLHTVVISANDDWSSEDSDESSLSESEENRPNQNLSQFTCSPLSTAKDDFYFDKGDINSYKENIIPDVSQDLNADHHIQLLNPPLLNQALPRVTWFNPTEHMLDVSSLNKSVLWRIPNAWDLSSIDRVNKTNEERRETTNLPDDEFMEEDRYIGDKGKQPVSKKYAYKKKSKSTVNQSPSDVENNTNNLMAYDIKTNYPTSSSNAVPTTLPSGTSHSLDKRIFTPPISNESSPESLKLSLISEEFKEAGIQWSFHDYARKLRPCDFDYPNSDDDANLQEGLLNSLQWIKTSHSDYDSDVDVTT